MTDLTAATIADAIRATPPQDPPTADHEATAIVAATADLFGLRPGDLVGPRCYHRVIDARFVAIAVVRARTGLSWPKIGDLFARDHTTCMHAAQRVMASPQRLAWAAAVQAQLNHTQEDP